MTAERLRSGRELQLLESTFGITFPQPHPQRERKSLRYTYHFVMDGFEKFYPYMPQLLKKPLSVGVAALTPVFNPFIEGHYDPVSHTYYEKNYVFPFPDIFGGLSVTPSDRRRFIALHELTHAYVGSKGYPNKGDMLKAAYDAVEQGKRPNLESLRIESMWAEGVCNFAAIYTELDQISQGLLAPENSLGLYLRFKFIGKFKPVARRNTDFVANLANSALHNADSSWLAKYHDKLRKNFSSTATSRRNGQFTRRDVQRVFLNGSPELSMMDEYVLGYNFANDVFMGLLDKGFSRHDAFEYLLTHPPQAIEDICNPQDFLNRNLDSQIS